MAKSIKKIVLFDAHAIIHRAYHALPEFSSSKGEPTGGLYGVATMLIRIISEIKPDYLAACFDRAEATFRKQVYEGYKAGRKKAEDELVAQLIRARDIFAAFNIPIFDSAGFEADDIIGTIVEQLKKEKNLQIIIASGDMDTLQLVDDERVVVYTLKKGITETMTYNEKEVVKRYGFAPKMVADFKGLKGDPSDNIIGVPGIGDKTATTLIQEFGSIEEIYRKLAKNEKQFAEKGIKPRMVELLKANEEEALFSKTLATIRRDAPIDFVLPGKNWLETFDEKKVEEIFNELEFRSLISRIKSLRRNEEGQASADAALTLLPAEEAEPPAGLSPDEIRKTAIALWLVNSDFVTPDYDDILRFARPNLSEQNLSEQAEINDFKKAHEFILSELDKRGLRKVYDEIELPLLPILKRARERGFLIDASYLKKLSKDYHEKLAKIESKIFELAGETFNINSPKQLGVILFDKLNLNTKGLKKTAGGARSTRESELQKMTGLHPIIDEILAYRELQKLLSTYIDNIPGMLNSTGALHTNLNQDGTTTGRMSSSNPNLQNIPARDGLGAAIRQAFVARQGFKLLAFDYSQIELRVLAALSGDKDLIEIFRAGKDIHASVASRVFRVPENEVTKEMRRRAKVINFGIIYGMGVNALRGNLGTTREEAQIFMDNYFETFPTIKKYFEDVVAEARRTGYTETMFGRRRYLPALQSRLPQIKASAERMAMNAPLQGTAADIIKLAMIKADRELEKAGFSKKVFPLLQIHDELIYEAEVETAGQASKIIQEAMEKAAEFPVPLEVDFSEGENWMEL